MHADGSDLLETLNSEEQEVCRHTIARTHKRLYITNSQATGPSYEQNMKDPTVKQSTVKEFAGITRQVQCLAYHIYSLHRYGSMHFHFQYFLIGP